MSTTAIPPTTVLPPPGTPPAAPATEATGPAERIGELRAQIDACDAEIIRLVQARLGFSREIGALRSAAGGTRLSLSREQAVLATFSAALGPVDGTSLGMMLLRRGRGAL